MNTLKGNLHNLKKRRCRFQFTTQLQYSIAISKVVFTELQKADQRTRSINTMGSCISRSPVSQSAEGEDGRRKRRKKRKASSAACGDAVVMIGGDMESPPVLEEVDETGGAPSIPPGTSRINTGGDRKASRTESAVSGTSDPPTTISAFPSETNLLPPAPNPLVPPGVSVLPHVSVATPATASYNKPFGFHHPSITARSPRTTVPPQLYPNNISSDAHFTQQLMPGAFLDGGRKSPTSTGSEQSHSLVPLTMQNGEVGGGVVAGSDFVYSQQNHNQRGGDALSEMSRDDTGLGERLDDDVGMTSEILEQLACLPERTVEALPILTLCQMVLCGALCVPPATDVGPAFYTKMKFRDIDGWLSEVGLVPAPVVSLVGGHHDSSSFSSGSGAVASGSQRVLTARQLEQNQRLVLQMKARTTPNNGSTNMALGLFAKTSLAFSNSTSPQHPTTQSSSNPLGYDPAPATGMSTMHPATVSMFLPGDGATAKHHALVADAHMLCDDDPGAFDEQRKASRTSASHRVPNRATDTGEVSASEFYEQLEEEERRLSSFDHRGSSSDEDYYD